MTKPARIDELLAAFYNGNEEEIDVEYIGKYRINGRMVLGVPTPDIETSWAQSVVPDVYLPLYGLKFSQPAEAGGLFESAPFDLYDRSDPEYQWMNPVRAGVV